MAELLNTENQIQKVDTFDELTSTPFQGNTNAICWQRNLVGDFSEIVDSIEINTNIYELGQAELLELELSSVGSLAREVLINDLNALIAVGADPTLNIIKNYERDDVIPYFPTDVYSFHVDRSEIPTSTYLCTYHGTSSEIVANSQAIQKVLIPELRDKLEKLYDGPEESFNEFLTEHFFDLHYQANTDANIVSLGQGNIWKLAIDHPESQVLPCLHRAPNEKTGQSRLLLIC